MPDDERPACALCGRRVRELTAHHLIPRSQHKRVVKRTDASLRELREATVDLCRPCHKMVHRKLTEKELAEEWNTLDRLRRHEELQTFIAWVRKQADRPITVR